MGSVKGIDKRENLGTRSSGRPWPLVGPKGQEEGMEITEPRESSSQRETWALTKPGPYWSGVETNNTLIFPTSNLLLLISISQTQLEARG